MVGRAEVGVWVFVVQHCGGSGNSSLWGREATSCLGGRERQYVLTRAADL